MGPIEIPGPLEKLVGQSQILIPQQFEWIQDLSSVFLDVL